MEPHTICVSNLYASFIFFFLLVLMTVDPSVRRKLRKGTWRARKSLIPAASAIVTLSVGYNLIIRVTNLTSHVHGTLVYGTE